MPFRTYLKSLPNLTSVVIISMMISLYLIPFADLDFGILIRLGQLIVETKTLHPPESFSYTIAGADVPDYEWLFEIFIWAVWTGFGYGGLKLLKILLVAATFVITGWRLHSAGVRWHGIALALGVATLIVAPSWNLRPLYFTTIGLLLISWWLHDHCTLKRPLTWWLVPVMWIWANVHPGVITGQGLLLGAIGWEWMNRWIRLNEPLDMSGLRRLTLVGGLGFAATFLSPDPIGRFLAPFQPEVRHPIMMIYDEMQPLYKVVFDAPYTYSLAYVLAVLVLITVVLRFRKYRMWELALLLGTAGLANMAIRSLQDWTLVMISVSMPHMVQLLRQSALYDRRRPWTASLLRIDRTCKRMLISPLFRFRWFWPAFALALLAVISLIPPLSRDMPYQARERDPVAAVDWIETHGTSAKNPWRIFSPPDYGTYLVWRLGDKVRVYVDTRGFCFPSKLMEDSHYVPLLVGDWKTRLSEILKGDTEYFLLEAQGGRSRLWHLLKKHGAEPIYADKKAVLLSADEVRRTFATIQSHNTEQNRT